ncbi:MAG: aminopeptidase P N-terminal domain-containing protein [Deltaproteobacteria bacterium]|nr:aminopeptidase P N-terminal domain-containing protein [Deltaproteobacteria bacterium]
MTADASSGPVPPTSSTNPLAPSRALRDELRARREAFLAKIEGDVAVITAAPVHIRNNDVEHHFRQDSDFFYLTGYDEPDAVAVLSRVHDEHRYVLFVRTRDPERETWDGPRSGADGAKADFDADAAFPIGELGEKLPGYLENARRLHYALGRDPKMDARVLAARDFVRRRQRFGVMWPSTLVDLAETVHPMRLTKSAYEVEDMRAAARATTEGHLAAMEVARPGAYEHEVEAEILRAFRRHGSPRPAYESIVGSGPNATILHYRKNDRLMQDGELLLIDAGAEIAGYAGDVTRTFPINGRFSAPQRRVYEAVLRAQMLAIEAVRPGTTVEAIHQITLRALTESSIALGLIEGPLEKALEEERYKKVYMHRTSHWLGMDVHDVGSYFVFEKDEPSAKSRSARVLEPGMVLTIEPGLYVGARTELTAEAEIYRGIGVRIEDDVLVTASGFEVLTSSIPKDPDEVEAILARRMPRA